MNPYILAASCLAIINLGSSCSAPEHVSKRTARQDQAKGVPQAVESETPTVSDDATGIVTASPEVKPEPEEKKEPELKIVTKDIGSSGASTQVKDINLLRSSIETCMGRDMLRVTEDMLIPSDLTVSLPKLPEGRIRFLLAAQYRAGDDIVTKEASNLVDLSQSSRTNNTADSLTDTYLRSLETIGNVVAHNCTSNNPNCQCGSKEAALVLMSRCLPGLNPSTVEMADTAALLGGICGENAEGMRKAIASLIASYVFAVAR